MSKLDKIRPLIGFANKAGKLTLGRTATESAYFRGKLELIIITPDASPKLKRFIQTVQDTPVLRVGSKDEMGKIVGRDQVAIIGVADRNFAEAIQNV